jgi:hypothetical protein
VPLPFFSHSKAVRGRAHSSSQLATRHNNTKHKQKTRKFLVGHCIQRPHWLWGLCGHLDSHGTRLTRPAVISDLRLATGFHFHLLPPPATQGPFPQIGVYAGGSDSEGV